MRPDPVLLALERKQAEIAKQAMETPGANDLFAYGRACGIYAGLALARQVVLDILADREEKDREL